MRLPPTPQTLLPTLLLLPAITNASIDCSHVRVDGISFNLSPLSGPHQVSDIQEHEDPPQAFNSTTYTLDVCRPLPRSKGVPKEEECESGTQVCGIKRTFDPSSSTTSITVIPIAGTYPHSSGRTVDPKWTRLKTSPSHADSAKEGIRLEMHGGMSPLRERRKQEAVIEFLCAAAAETGEEGEGDPGPSFVSYGPLEGAETDVLRLEWRTRHACEDDVSGGQGKGGHWGFFTWFILIAFLGTASYLIFGSWLNYNRYGARGWDLLPHGDTIRDVPYLAKDWARRVVGTVSGGGSRGGYSAV